MILAGSIRSDRVKRILDYLKDVRIRHIVSKSDTFATDSIMLCSWISERQKTLLYEVPKKNFKIFK